MLEFDAIYAAFGIKARVQHFGFRVVACAVALSLLTYSAIRSEAQVTDRTERLPVSPTLSEILTETAHFFASWSSAAVRIRSTRYFAARKQPPIEWQELAFGDFEHSWSDTGSREASEGIATPYSAMRSEFVVSRSESVLIDAGLLVVSVEARTRVPDHFDEGRWRSPEVDEEHPLRVTLHSVTASSGAVQRVNPPEMLLCGVYPLAKNRTPELLERFRTATDVQIEAVSLGGRNCWRLTEASTDRQGHVQMTVCPELGWAPLEIDEALGPEDRVWSGAIVGELSSDEGKPYQAIRSSHRLETIDPAWKEFSIRSETVSVDSEGAESGFSELQRFHSILRPAPDSAFLMKTQIPNGTPVVLMDSQQIKAEWRDGKVVRVYDGEAVKELATVRMAPAGPNWVRWSVLAALTVGGGLFAWKRWGRKAAAKAKPGLPRR